jgi:hypothetical protein
VSSIAVIDFVLGDGGAYPAIGRQWLQDMNVLPLEVITLVVLCINVSHDSQSSDI